MIAQSFIADLLNRVDIEEVVGRYVQLKKAGANLMGLCPFHNEKSPSFTVSPTKQFYHCFGCGVHGTAISFLMEYSGLGFVEAVKELAKDVGMIVPDDDKLPPMERLRQQEVSLALSEVMTRANTFYRDKLRGAESAIAYLKNRGLTGEIAARFGLGYAPSGWDNLREIFPDYDAAVLSQAGLVIDKQDDANAHKRRYDRFRDRIMFPIKNIKGQVIGFGARVLDGGEPKYLNSPETPLFQKGSELYGLFEARVAIREAGYVLVTEGYMDVVALAQLGFAQAVATLGTACTATHVQKLMRQTDRVIFSFDGDSAGLRAARRALEACLPHVLDNKNIMFLFLPSEHDPDSYVRQYGSEEFSRQIAQAMPLSEFLLKEVVGDTDLTTPEGRARVQFDAKPMIKSMQASALRLQIVRGLAQLTQSSAAELESLFELTKAIKRTQIAPPKMKRAAPMGLERQMMRLLIAHPSLVGDLDQSLLDTIAQLSSDDAMMLQQLIDHCQQLGKAANFANLTEQLRGAEFGALIAQIGAESESDIDAVRMELIAAARQVKMQILKRDLDQLVAKGLGSQEARAQYRDLLNQQTALREALLNA